ncbi:uncharacterized protein LOC128951586 [Oppia nitens]|uniref:uncharacterized protein LOC128951586 n=1 Tax=Oppia nitens TaxID=1686743 RepID=UPI0023D9CD8A|nr:uncharacterized protein LOC128951586 [Oppia nitens]
MTKTIAKCVHILPLLLLLLVVVIFVVIITTGANCAIVDRHNHQQQPNRPENYDISRPQNLRKLLQVYNNNGRQQTKVQYYNNCPIREREKMSQCDSYAADDWDVREVQQDYSSRSYCCYHWQSLKCKLKIAKRCDINYANWLEQDTDQRLGSLCYYHGRYSASCALRWWHIIFIVIGGLLLLIGLGYFIWWACKIRRENRYRY